MSEDDIPMINNNSEIIDLVEASRSGKLCHCDLSGEIYVVTSSTCCEVCKMTGLLPLTAENVKKALEFTRDVSEGFAIDPRKARDLFFGRKKSEDRG